MATPPLALIGAADRLFGDRLDLACRYAELLTTDGIVRGLIGPRESPRIWRRHLLNCAAVAELIAMNSKVVDVGSGAGLPGIALAIARPDLSVVLLEPLRRRTDFLDEVVTTLSLGRATVIRSRAEDAVGLVEPVDVAVARAVAALDRLAAWCLPLVKPGGHLLALKGDTARDEVESHAAAVRVAGGGTPEIRLCGVGLVDPPTTVVRVERQNHVASHHPVRGRR
jgi:16S rRNA (guanine527-N7)-methyltransferase